MADHDLPLTGKGFRQLTVFSSGWILILIIVGAIVRVTGSGMGCPDWPLCHNQLIPPAQISAWIEFSHRLVAGVAVLLVSLIAILAWRHYRQHHLVFIPALGALGLILLQALLGAVTVWFGNQPVLVIGHLLTAMTYLALILFLATVSHLPAAYVARAGLSAPSHKLYFRFLLLTGAALLILLATGAVVTSTHSALACPDWPLCRGEIFPLQADLATIIQLIHRFSIVAVGVAVSGIVLAARRRYSEHRLLVRWSTIIGFLFLVQMGVGGLNVLVRLSTLTAVLHVGLAAATWGSLVILISIFYLTARSVLPQTEVEEKQTPASGRQKAAIYFRLTKPWIMVLLLITTVGAMIIAAGGLPSIPLLLYTLLGGMLSAGGASVLNSYVDTDIDRVMSRTSRRPTVTGLVTPEETLFFGLVLSTLSFIVFAVFVNTLSAALSTLGIFYYVFFYTLYLKRNTFHNIIIGGVAGAIPPLVGWTAVTNRLDLGALYLFAIIFFWTPPHTWALALLIKKDYAQARVPMLPVIAGEKETTYQIFLYTILLVTLTLLPFTSNMLSLAYLLAALALGIPFIYLAWKLWQSYNKSLSRRIYKFSQLYLALLFVAMAVDRSLF